MARTQLERLVFVSLLGAAACGSGASSTDGSAQNAAGASATSPAGVQPSAAGAPDAGGSRASAATGGKPASSAAAGSSTAAVSGGAGASTGGQAAPVSAAGTGGTSPQPSAAGAPATAARPTECNGVPLPERALGKSMPPFTVGPESAGLPAYWPTMGWKTEMPDKLGFDAAKLSQAVDFKTQYSNTQAVFVVRHGYLAAEKYTGFSATQRHESYSMAKSFSSGLIGIAIGEGKLSGTDVKLCEYYPEQWDCSDTSDPRSRITLEHAMNLSTGLMWHEDWRTGATGTNDAVSSSVAGMLDTVLARKSENEPGTKQRYSTGDPSLLTGVIQKSTGMTALEYGKQKLFDVIGISPMWSADNKGRTTTYAGIQATAAEYAKYGYLVLNRGKWDGKQVIPAEWIDKTTQGMKPCDDWYQWLWHVNLPNRLGKQPADCVNSGKSFCTPTDIANLPPDSFSAKGVNGQLIMIVPSADLVVVRLASDQAGSEHWDEYARGLLTAVLDAIK